jgi:hypothetical protein
MVAAGAEIPVTTPPALTVARAVLLELHMPPVAASLSVIVPPTATADEPVIAATDGTASTVTTLVAVQPVVAAKVMVAVPADMPATTPEINPTVATDGVLLVHDVPLPLLVNITVLPTHRPALPAIAAGSPFTVTA